MRLKFHYDDTQDYKTDNGDSTSAQKSLSIHNAPQILVIHLKRFEWATTKNHGRKLAKPIRFPECLTLPQNVYPAAMVRVARCSHFLHRHLIPNAVTQLAADSVEREYTLRSVVHHIGATLEACLDCFISHALSVDPFEPSLSPGGTLRRRRASWRQLAAGQ